MRNTTIGVLEVAAPEGWKFLFVGGCVRDWVMGREPKDLDIEVYGPRSMLELAEFLGKFGKVDLVGASFGVIQAVINGQEFDFSLPRRENRLGQGHKGFDVVMDSTMTIEEAAARRDFTVNSIAMDNYGNLFDPYMGVWDIRDGVLRATSQHFMEDPLRVLRGMKFASRYGWEADSDTVAMCREMLPEARSLPIERYWPEWMGWALGRKPSMGLRLLEETNWLKLFPELEALIGVEQDPSHHPEGDVWQHTLLAVDAAAALSYESDEERALAVFGALLHDVGKPSTTEIGEDGRIHTFSHDGAGEAIVPWFGTSIGMPPEWMKKVGILVREHMAHVHMGRAFSDTVLRRFRLRLENVSPALWAKVVEADHSARPPLEGGLPEKVVEILRRLDSLGIKNEGPKPIFMGRHLIEAGWKPGPHFKTFLDEAFQAQLDGAFFDLEGAWDWYRCRMV
jgi:tRNA nucleotidyltransferase (CCA-adding enzyme)